MADPVFDESAPFEEVQAPRFDPQAPFDEYSPRVAAMASATRSVLDVANQAASVASYDPASARLETTTFRPDLVEDVAKDEWGRPLDPRGRNPAQLNPSLTRSRTPDSSLSALMTPLVPIRKAFTQGEQLSYLADKQPEGEAKKALTTAAGVVSGLEDVAGGAMEFMTSPVGISTMGLGAAPGALRSLASATFAADMISHAPEALKEFQVATTPEDKARALTKGIGNLALAGAASWHAIREAKYAAAGKAGDLSRALDTAPLTMDAVHNTVPFQPVPLSSTPLTTAATEAVKTKAVRETTTPAPAPAELLTPKEFGLQVYGSPTQHLIEALSVRKPVNADLFDQQRSEATKREPALDLPEGYVRDGDLYVYKPTSTPLTTSATQAVVEKGPSALNQSQAATLHESLPPQPITSEGQVPAEVGGKGVQPYDEAGFGTTPPVGQPQGKVEKGPGASPAPSPATITGESGKGAPVSAGAPPSAAAPIAQGEALAKPKSEQTLTPKWTTATRAGVELGTKTLAGIPDPVATFKAAVALAKEAGPAIKRAGKAVADVARTAKAGVGEYVTEQTTPGKMTDYRRSVLNWSSKLQTSFGEAEAAQREIRSSVPNALKREGITNWIQAGGDPSVLRSRADATADPKLKAGYESALALSPDEIRMAEDVRRAFEELGSRGSSHDVLGSFVENYVPQTWDLGKGPHEGGGRTLKEKFRFSKARTFETYFEGEQAGYTPKTKDIAKLLPMYLHEMNSVIAARQLVQEMAGGVASDGRPLLAPRGGGVPVEGGEGKATLVMPKQVKGDTGDYKVLQNQPALTDWRWATKDSEGNPVFLKADLALHPEAYARLKNVLGKSAIKEWYQTRTTAAAQIPKMIVKGIDVGQQETKRTMLGFFAPFHQVQEGTHAVGHRVNPFGGIPKIDLVNNADQKDATRHGLMLLPDRNSAEQFMEGFRHSGLVSRIPGVGPLADMYSHYLFQQYIPGLKFKTYQHILERNQKVYAKELASGAVKPEDIKVLSAEQSNAAYGHLNYADLARNPTIQHVAQLGLLAPDFFEARARFAAQGAKGAVGAKAGREQIVALATLAIAQATTAWIAAQTTGGSWDAKHPFEMVKDDRRYSMRSVPEDLAGLIADSRKFIYSRLSPLVGKGIVQGLSGVDYKGSKVSAGDTAKELATAPVPLPLRGFLGTSGRNLSAFEELAGSVGLRISRYYPEEVTHAMQLRDEVDLWINRSKKLDTDEERAAYLNKQLAELETKDKKQAVIRIKQHTAKGVRQKIR